MPRLTDKYHSGIPADRLPPLRAAGRGAPPAPRPSTVFGLVWTVLLGTLGAAIVAFASGLMATPAGRTVYDQQATLGQSYPATAMLFAEAWNEDEFASEGNAVIHGCKIQAGTSSGTFKVNPGYTDFGGLMTYIGGASGAVADNQSFLTLTGVSGQSFDRWALIELTPSNTYTVTLGNLATSTAPYPEPPAVSSASNVVAAWVYIPAGTPGAVEDSSSGTYGSQNGNAKIMDMRRIVRQSQTRWIADANTWTNTVTGSSSTQAQFTIAGDYHLRYIAGTKMRWSESGTVKYGYVVSSSYSSPNTTVTLVANNDYSMLATPDLGSNFFCDSGAVPPDFSEWMSYTPTFAGFSGTPASYVARFCIKGHTCFVALDMSVATSLTSNATTFTFSLPITSHTNLGIQSGPFMPVDNGVAQTAPGLWQVPNNTTTCTLYKTYGSAAWTSSGNKAACALMLAYSTLTH